MKRVEFIGCRPKVLHYVALKSGGELNFKSFEARICFFGHTHKPVILEQTLGGEVKGLCFGYLGH